MIKFKEKKIPVSYIEPNETDYKPLDYKPKDPRFWKQWALKGFRGINALKAWNIQKGSNNVVVAVLDTGSNYKHPDLKNNLWINKVELNGKPGFDDDGNGYIDDIYGTNTYSNNGNPMDGHGHGTHCAGVIGASHNNLGISGIMANVQIMSVKIFSNGGSATLESIVKGVEYAIQNKAKIMSNSWGSYTHTQAVEDAMKAAADAGILIVAAAGNGNYTGKGTNNDYKPMYPASLEFDEIISVGAIASSGRRSQFSNYGKTSVDLFAPGEKILSTHRRDYYKNLSGTSMAAPHVSGVAGLLASQYPDISALEIKSKIMRSVKHQMTSRSESVSGGSLDAGAALEL